MKPAILSEFDYEPVPGLSEPLAAGERILWQGAPLWHVLALRKYQVRNVAIYFGVMLVWHLASTLMDSPSLAAAGRASIWVIVPWLLASALLLGLAWLTGRTSLYTITSERLVMRIGIALPMTVSIPFRCIESAACALHHDGTADLPIVLQRDRRISTLVAWPHVRSFWARHPQPMLLAVPEGHRVAQILSGALRAALDSDTQTSATASYGQPQTTTPPLTRPASVAA